MEDMKKHREWLDNAIEESIDEEENGEIKIMQGFWPLIKPIINES